MRLYLVQHGEALSKDVDPERPLSARGRSDVERLAAFLKGQVQIVRVVHSGKTRARQTAEILAAALAPDRPLDIIKGIDPQDATAPFAQAIAKSTEETLVVGHLPFMGKLAARLLTGSDGTDVVDYRPGSIVCLESENGEDWRLQWLLRPELLGPVNSA